MSTNVPPIIMTQAGPGDPFIALPVPVIFLSPEKISIANNVDIKSVNTDNKNGDKYFKRVTKGDFTVPLFIDRTESPLPLVSNARTEVLLMRSLLLLPRIVLPLKGKVVPKCRFIWGTFFVEGHCTSLTEEYTYFSSAGIPLRAEVSLTIGPTDTFIDKFINSNIAGSRKFWTVKSGDRLDLIASSVYNDATLWRPIAEANSISQPLAFPRPEDVGRSLIIPDEATIARGV